MIRVRARAALVGVLSVALAVSTLTVWPAVAPRGAVGAADAAEAAQALSGSDFDPGFIISDANFYDPNAMSAAEVQTFLDSKVASCVSGYVCLKDLRVDTWSIAGNPMCTAYQGAAGESAATIIYKVGRACGVSQAALLVTLQKEQSLVTNRSPSKGALSAAMGVGCYDNGQPCVGEYAGFFNQLYNGAYLFKRYTQPAGTGPGTPYTTRFDRSYPVGQTSQILYSPDSGCGTKSVYIQNQATHALYVYTPYTPNAAALSNLYGTGDDCSSYGNRNFWRIYSDWFGDPRKSRIPIGWLDGIGVVRDQITASGWALDSDTTGAIGVVLTVDGTTVVTATADLEYPGLAAAQNLPNSRHGFSLSTTASPGSHQVCVIARNDGVGDDRALGCRTVTIAGTNAPLGWLDSLTVAASQATAVGWAIDADTAGPISIAITIDGGAPQTFTANVSRPGFGSSFPGFGDAHGFAATVTVPAGKHTLCVTALDDAGGASRDLGCRTVSVSTGTAPLGWLDSVAVVGTTVSVQGWALDRDTLGPIGVRVAVDGVAQMTTADRTYPGLGSVHTGYGDDHGFALAVSLPSGSHTLCVTAVNDGAGGDRDLGCRTVAVTIGNAPIGWIDSVRVEFQQVTLAGWALDRDTADPIAVSVTIDGGAPATFTADVVKPGFGNVNPGYGDLHAFIAEVTVPIGPHVVCVNAIDDAGGGERSLGCRTVTGVSQPPLGWVDGTTVVGGAVTVTGWAIDRDTTAPTAVRATFDGVTTVDGVADLTKAGLGAVHVGFGDDHGFALTTWLPAGNHVVCVTAVNDSAGSDQPIGCRTFTTTTGNAPIGWLDEVKVAAGTVTPVGWAIDPDTASAIAVDVVVDGVRVSTVQADVSRAGFGGIFRGFGDAHGFDSTTAVTPGSHEVCVVARNDSGATNSALGCRSVIVP